MAWYTEGRYSISKRDPADAQTWQNGNGPGAINPPQRRHGIVADKTYCAATSRPLPRLVQCHNLRQP